MNADIAISVQNVSKAFRIWNSPASRLLSPLWQSCAELLPDASASRKQLREKASSHYRDFWALKDISFEVKKGEAVGIIGRNGSGKSTLLQIIAGTLQPTSGRIHVSGRVAALLELGSGFNPEFTGRENVYLNGAVLGFTRNEIDARIESILQFADIGEFIDQPVKTYSSGMSVRLAFAVQTAINPDILIIDEALSVGDESFQRKCFRRIENLRADGTTLLFVSHDAGSVIKLCNHGLLLRHGAVFVQGNPKAVVTVYHKSNLDSGANDQELLADFRKLSSASLPESEQPLTETAAGHPAISAPVAPVPLVVSARDDDSYWDPSLVAAHPVIYAARGATISDPHIETPGGRRVNNLIPGHDYVYTYRVDFSATATGVQFGSLIKSLDGHEIGGMLSHPHRERDLCVFENECYHVRLHFTCHLSHGTYAINCGVLALINNEDVYLHRIIDAVLFRVIADPASLTSGYVGFTRSVEFFKIPDCA
jgi:lipopolysaccharide transport system ATP-binding protein